MHLILPRPYPECLKRYPEPFGVLETLYIDSLGGTPVPIGWVRSLDCKKRATIKALLRTAKIHRLTLLDYESAQGGVCLDYLERFVRLYPGHTTNGYVATSLRREEIIGWEYSVSFQGGKLKVGEQVILPKLIPLGFDVIFLAPFSG